MPRKNSATVREMMQKSELDRRAVASKKTEFDQPATIMREGNRIVVPTDMSPETVLSTIKTWVESEEKLIAVNSTIEGIPIDAAYALQNTILHELGFTDLQSTPGFWGNTPPTFLSVPIDHTGATADVYVGRMALPGLENAWLQSQASEDQLTLHVSAQVKKKQQYLLNQILDRARDMVREESLYKGKAFELELDEQTNDGSTKMVIPKFWNIAEEKQLILNADAQGLIEATLWTPILKAAALRKRGIPIKRGILLNGKFGTGKTLCAYKTAQYACSAGFTFAYIKKISKLAQTFEFMQRNLAPGVIFVEDADKAFEDPAQINIIQNTLDGIDSKNSEIIVVMTTNYVEQIPPGVVRPGRIDTLINLDPPDAEAAGKLVAHYGRGLLDPSVDFEEVGRAIAGNIPAVIREVVERAKLYALASADDEDAIVLRTADLLGSIRGMEQHLSLLNRGGMEFTLSPAGLLGHALGAQIGAAIKEGMADIVTGRAIAGEKVTADRSSGGKKIVQ